MMYFLGTTREHKRKKKKQKKGEGGKGMKARGRFC